MKIGSISSKNLVVYLQIKQKELKKSSFKVKFTRQLYKKLKVLCFTFFKVVYLHLMNEIKYKIMKNEKSCFVSCDNFVNPLISDVLIANVMRKKNNNDNGKERF